MRRKRRPLPPRPRSPPPERCVPTAARLGDAAWRSVAQRDAAGHSVAQSGAERHTTVLSSGARLRHGHGGQAYTSAPSARKEGRGGGDVILDSIAHHWPSWSALRRHSGSVHPCAWVVGRQRDEQAPVVRRSARCIMWAGAMRCQSQGGWDACARRRVWCEAQGPAMESFDGEEPH